MSEVIEIRKLNEVHAKVLCEEGIAAELSEFFTFTVPNARFSPAFKNKWWDGKIRLFNRVTHTIPMGLVSKVVQYAENNAISVSYAVPSDFSDVEFSVKEAEEFIVTLNIPEDKKPRDYQIEGFVDAVRRRRALQICPTASGKSLLIYLILMYYIKVRRLKSNLVIVPNTSLVKQLSSDFREYGFKGEIQEIFHGQEHNHHTIVITTWQSAKDFPKGWFHPFDLIIGDEAHTFNAKSLQRIMDSLENCMNRVGVTGSMNGAVVNELTLQGLFGAKKVLAKTKELQDKGYLAELKIKALLLQYSKEDRELVKKMDYVQERDFLIRNPRRNKFIRNLALSLKGNTIVLFRNKEHGKVLYEVIQAQAKNRPVYFVDGDVDVEIREQIRKKINTDKDAIAVVSYGTFSTGINIVNLENIVFGSPSKGRIRVLQSIGRGLRKGGDKTVATLYDIVDDLSWKGRSVTHKNYMLEHFQERLNLYVAEQFPYKLYTIGLE